MGRRNQEGRGRREDPSAGLETRHCSRCAEDGFRRSRQIGDVRAVVRLHAPRRKGIRVKDSPDKRVLHHFRGRRRGKYHYVGALPQDAAGHKDYDDFILGKPMVFDNCVF